MTLPSSAEALFDALLDADKIAPEEKAGAVGADAAAMTTSGAGTDGSLDAERPTITCVAVADTGAGAGADIELSAAGDCVTVAKIGGTTGVAAVFAVDAGVEAIGLLDVLVVLDDEPEATLKGAPLVVGVVEAVLPDVVCDEPVGMDADDEPVGVVDEAEDAAAVLLLVAD